MKTNLPNSYNPASRVCTGDTGVIELFRVEDSYGLLRVTQRGDKRILSFGSGLEQSSMYMNKRHYLSHEYTKIMLLGFLFTDAKNISILGLGGGGLAHCLLHYFPQCKINIIELRQLVIDIAHDWFELPKKDSLKIYCIDAYDYLQSQNRESTDLIMSDLYVADGMSQVQAQVSFIESSYKVLNEQGCLVVNFHHLPEADSLLMQKIHGLFNTVFICDVFKGNKVIFCCKRTEKIALSELKLKVKALVKIVEIPLMYYVKQLKIFEKI